MISMKKTITKYRANKNITKYRVGKNLTKYRAGMSAAGISLLLFAVALGFVKLFLYVHGKTWFASPVDWIAQHSVFPDYFRKLFYETGELYPDFAIQIGGGQNIFNFAYYGFLSPQILLSYLFPQIKMDYWIMGVSFADYAVSGILLYHWFRSRGMRRELCFWMPVLFLLSASLLYHSCVQILFVNYMPFVCLGLIGTDRYFEKNRPGLLIVSVCLLILSSFYFSIGGMACLCLYALYCYRKQTSQMSVGEMLGAAGKYLGMLGIGILLSGFFLVPTAVALVNGRNGEGSHEAIQLLSLFLPQKADPNRIFLGKYGVGLSCLSGIGLFAGSFSKKRENRMLSLLLLVILTFPVFDYILNGFLYNRAKSLIPFLPLVCFQTAVWLMDLEEESRQKSIDFGKKKRTGRKKRFLLLLKVLIPCLILFVYFKTASDSNLEYRHCEIDLLVSGLAVLAYVLFRYYRHFTLRIILIPSVVIVLLISMESWQKGRGGLTTGELNLEKQEAITREVKKHTDPLYRTEYYGDADENFQNINRIFDVNQKISSVYSSTFHTGYTRFRDRIFHVEKPYRNILMNGLSDNEVFRRFMGVKYLISEKEDGQLAVRELEAAPIAYGTSRLITQAMYDQLGFPENQLAFLYTSVLPQGEAEEDTKGGFADSENTGFLTSLSKKKQTLDLSGQIEGDKNRLSGKTITVSIPASEKEQILFVRFHVENHKNEDVNICLEGSRNTLSSEDHIYYNQNTEFTYGVWVAPNQKQVTFEYGTGDYEVRDSEVYLVEVEETSSNHLYESKFQVQEGAKTKTEVVLSGDIDMKKSGYLITSIPYDSHFQVLVDGKKTQARQVNQAFLGVPLTKGTHHITVTYHSPGKVAGLGLSLLGILLFFWIERRAGKRKA